MPLIEELPVTATHRTSHGWAYVPDIRPALPPLEARKRGAARPPRASKGDLTAKQQKALQIKLTELDKENYKDSTIAIPTRAKDRAAAGKKITPNVRRILTYQRTFAHYLADEEAQLAQNGQPAVTTTSLAAALATKPTAAAAAMQPPPRPGSAKRRPAATPKRPRSASASITTPTTTNDPTTPQPAAGTLSSTPPPSPLNPTQHLRPDAPSSIISGGGDRDRGPALGPVPKPHSSLLPPSSRLLHLLVSEPALSYSGARAQGLADTRQPSSSTTTTTTSSSSSSSSALPKPIRHFCAICGYWGKVKCGRCGERTCGLMDCWTGHDGVCSVPAY